MIRKAMKWSLVASAAILVTGVLVGPRRLHDLAATVRSHVVDNVDSMIDQKVKLQNEVLAMQREYPQQLATLRSQLTEVDNALALVEEELIVSEQVVVLCSDDLETLRPQAATVAYGSGASPRALNARIDHVTHTRQIYQSRVDLASQERVVLESERRQITAELASLEQEAAEFQSQLALIQNEIESLARSEKLIEIAERRRSARHDRIGTRAAGALERLNQTIAAERARQTETLRGLAETQSSNEYELRAKLLLEATRHAEAGRVPADEEASEHSMF